MSAFEWPTPDDDVSESDPLTLSDEGLLGGHERKGGNLRMPARPQPKHKSRRAKTRHAQRNKPRESSWESFNDDSSPSDDSSDPSDRKRQLKRPLLNPLAIPLRNPLDEQAHKKKRRKSSRSSSASASTDGHRRKRLAHSNSPQSEADFFRYLWPVCSYLCAMVTRMIQKEFQ